MWIFGYGSLVWKADFPYVKKIIGYVKGYERKFWQASIDHRGVPGKPGRVVTLVPVDDIDTRVWGTAYKIHPKDVDFVIRHLDLREKMGYEKVPEEFYPIPNHPMNLSLDSNSLDSSYSSNLSDDSGYNCSLTNSTNSESESNIFYAETDDILNERETDSKNGSPFEVTMYFGSDTNEHFIGPESEDEIAQQIFQCCGYSGPNRDYLYNLAESMREICEEALDSHLSYLEKAVKALELEDEHEQGLRQRGLL